MDKHSQYDRCTGHTTRMLREAVILVLCGKTVAVFTHTEHLAIDLKRQTERILSRLAVGRSAGWDDERISFHGVRAYPKLMDQMEKEGVVVMADPGLADVVGRRCEMLGLPLPADWPT